MKLVFWSLRDDNRMLGVCWAHVGSMLGRVGHIDGPMLGYVEACWAILGPCCLGLCWAYVRPMLRHAGPMLGPCWAHVGPMLGHVEPKLTWPILGPFNKHGKTQNFRAK